jgi:hypothetical protein
VIRARPAVATAAALAAFGCAATPPPDTASIPLWAAPYWPGDEAAIMHAEWAWADPARTHGIPAEGTRAVAEIDYLAGELSSIRRWGALSPFAKLRMIQARGDVRRALGIAPDAPSGAVVVPLIAALAAMDAGDMAQVRASLSAPAFTLGPDRTLALLDALPYVRNANLGTTMAARSAQGPGAAEHSGS